MWKEEHFRFYSQNDIARMEIVMSLLNTAV